MKIQDASREMDVMEQNVRFPCHTLYNHMSGNINACHIWNLNDAYVF